MDLASDSDWRSQARLYTSTFLKPRCLEQPEYFLLRLKVFSSTALIGTLNTGLNLFFLLSGSSWCIRLSHNLIGKIHALFNLGTGCISKMANANAQCSLAHAIVIITERLDSTGGDSFDSSAIERVAV